MKKQHLITMLTLFIFVMSFMPALRAQALMYYTDENGDSWTYDGDWVGSTTEPFANVLTIYTHFDPSTKNDAGSVLFYISKAGDERTAVIEGVKQAGAEYQSFNLPLPWLFNVFSDKKETVMSSATEAGILYDCPKYSVTGINFEECAGFSIRAVYNDFWAMEMEDEAFVIKESDGNIRLAALTNTYFGEKPNGSQTSYEQVSSGYMLTYRKNRALKNDKAMQAAIPRPDFATSVIYNSIAGSDIMRYMYRGIVPQEYQWIGDISLPILIGYDHYTDTDGTTVCRYLYDVIVPNNDGTWRLLWDPTFYMTRSDLILTDPEPLHHESPYRTFGNERAPVKCELVFFWRSEERLDTPIGKYNRLQEYILDEIKAYAAQYDPYRDPIDFAGVAEDAFYFIDDVCREYAQATFDLEGYYTGFNLKNFKSNTIYIYNNDYTQDELQVIDINSLYKAEGPKPTTTPEPKPTSGAEPTATEAPKPTTGADITDIPGITPTATPESTPVAATPTNPPIPTASIPQEPDSPVSHLVTTILIILGFGLLIGLSLLFVYKRNHK